MRGTPQRSRGGGSTYFKKHILDVVPPPNNSREACKQHCACCFNETRRISCVHCIYIFRLCRFGFQLTSALAAAERRQGFDIILDAVSGEYFSPGFNLLAPGGRYVIYGAANWTPSGHPQELHSATLSGCCFFPAKIRAPTPPSLPTAPPVAPPLICSFPPLLRRKKLPADIR